MTDGKKNWSYGGSLKGVCELCGAPFERTAHTRHKRFCSERHRKIAEKRRYAERSIERATCKGCGDPFERTVTSKVYCTLACQYATRSVEYAGRPDIQAGIARAGEIARAAA